jgi:hypothetical protein
MATYGLKVHQLGSVVGMVNAISNIHNAPSKEIFEGLTRTASVAKQAGIGLPELMGLIGGGIGETKDTGSRIGNMLKSTIVSLSNKDVQSFLRLRHGIEVKADQGEVKNASQVLGNIFSKYQGMDSGDRQELLMRVAGKTQASRLAAELDAYVKSQILAITAQLNLNSAMQENDKIVSSLRNQVKGLKTEWDRLFVNNRIIDFFGREGVKEVSHPLRLLNEFGGSGSLGYKAKLAGSLFMETLSGGRVSEAVMMKEHLPEIVRRMNEDKATQGALDSEGKSNAATQAQNLLKNISASWGTATPEAREKMLKDLDKLPNVPGKTAMLAALRASATSEAATRAIAPAMRSLGATAGEAQSQHKAAMTVLRRAAIRELLVARELPAGEARDRRVGEAQARLSDLRDRGAKYLQEYGEGRDSEEMSAEERGRHFGREYSLNALGGLFGESSTATGRLRLQNMSSGEKLRYLRAQLGRRDISNEEMGDIRKSIIEEEGRMRGGSEAFGFAAREDRAGFARTFVGAQLEGGTYGDTELQRLERRLQLTERLMEQKRQLVQTSADGEARENAQVELLELQEDRQRTLLEMERARGRARQELYEEERQLMSASPQDLLRRSLAHRLLSAPGGLSGGAFMAMSPEMRAAILAEQRMMEHQRAAGDVGTLASEQRLRSLQGSVLRDQYGYNRNPNGERLSQTTMDSRGRIVEVSGSGGGSAATTETVGMAAAAATAAAQLGTFTSAVGLAADQIARFFDPSLRNGEQGPPRATAAPFVAALHGD